MKCQRTEVIFGKMILSYPWFASVGLNLKRVYTEQVPTMGVDGTRLYINPNFVSTISDKELMGVLIHEICHCVLLHPYRRNGRDPVRWNLACDQAVNKIVLDCGLVLPKGHVPPDVNNLTAEELYARIPENNNSFPKEFQDILSSSPLEKKLTESDWKAIINSSGRVPGNVQRLVEDVLTPKVDWKEALAAFYSALLKSNETNWSKLNRRVSGFPGKKKLPQTHVGIAIDTSGSIIDEVLSAFVAEVKSIASCMNIKTTLVTCDTEIHEIIEQDEEISLSFTGGGGTSFVPVFDFFSKREIDALIYFTDGEGEFPEDYDRPCLWAMTTDADAPFGNIIRLEGLG